MPKHAKRGIFTKNNYTMQDDSLLQTLNENHETYYKKGEKEWITRHLCLLGQVPTHLPKGKFLTENAVFARFFALLERNVSTIMYTAVISTKSKIQDI